MNCLILANHIYYFFKLKKNIFSLGSFEGDTFSQASGVLVQFCKSAKSTARWRCGLPIKKSESTLKQSVHCSPDLYNGMWLLKTQKQSNSAYSQKNI